MENEPDLETVEIKRFQCRHIFAAGHRCGSPALRSENFCYFHHATRKVADPYELHARRAHGKALAIPVPEDRATLLLAIGEVLHGLATRTIDRKDAGLMLYGLQVANSALPREPQFGGPARANSRTQPRHAAQENRVSELLPVEETVYDEHLGLTAPPAEFVEPEQEEKRKSFAQQLAEIVDGYEERRASELQQEETHREEIAAAVRTARAEALQQAAAEASAHLEELVASARAAAIAETEARLRAEFGQTRPASIPVIQAVADQTCPAASRSFRERPCKTRIQTRRLPQKRDQQPRNAYAISVSPCLPVAAAYAALLSSSNPGRSGSSSHRSISPVPAPI